AWQCIDDDELHIWDVRAGKEVRRLPQGKGGSYFLAYAPTGDRLVSVTNRLRLWDPETGKEVYQKPFGGMFLTYSPGGARLALHSDPIRIREGTAGGGLAPTPGGARHGGIWGLAFSPDGRYLAITERNDVGIYDVLAGRFVHTFRSHRYGA